ncbi:MAG: lycopene cyclase family protein [Phycisphaerales bacterium JB038]
MDVLVVGAGPAGMAASAALARVGLSVGCLAPSHPSPWPNNYGLWEDEIAGLGLSDCYDCRWEKPVVYTSKTHAHDLDRVYLRLDNDKLRDRLIDWCDQGGVRWLEGFAASIRSSNKGVTVLDRHGEEYHAALLIDATGHRPKFVERESGGANACQAAYGFVGDFDGDPIAGDEVVLMDFREDFLDAGPRRSPAATFLYAMELGDGRYFVEETSLVHRPALTFDVLEDRLAQRLRARGVPVVGVEQAERCLIPMNNPMPLLDQQVVGFGAAASMVHPATGYQMARMLRTAPELARAVALHLGKLGADPKEAARQAWKTIWPDQDVRARKLWMFGLECLLRLEPAQTRRFFEAFFSLPGEQWKGYMSGTLAPAEIAQVMWGLFRVAPMSLRVSLTKTAIGREGWEMIRALAG